MGHTRIGRLNRSQKWKDVVSAFCAGAGTEQISKQVLDAVEQAFNVEALSQDAGYQKAVELLVQMGIAALDAKEAKSELFLIKVCFSLIVCRKKRNKGSDGSRHDHRRDSGVAHLPGQPHPENF